MRASGLRVWGLRLDSKPATAGVEFVLRAWGHRAERARRKESGVERRRRSGLLRVFVTLLLGAAVCCAVAHETPDEKLRRYLGLAGALFLLAGVLLIPLLTWRAAGGEHIGRLLGDPLLPEDLAAFRRAGSLRRAYLSVQGDPRLTLALLEHPHPRHRRIGLMLLEEVVARRGTAAVPGEVAARVRQMVEDPEASVKKPAAALAARLAER